MKAFAVVSALLLLGASATACDGLLGIHIIDHASGGDAGDASPTDAAADTAVLEAAEAEAGEAEAGEAEAGEVEAAAPEASVDAAEGDGGGALDSGRDGGTVLPPSCAPGGAGMTDCGEDGGESCCTSLKVTGGTYYRTYTPDDAGNPTGEADLATVSDFRLDKYLVTVGRFRQFVNELYPDGGASLAVPPAPSWTPDAGSGKHTHLNGGRGLANAAGDGGTTYEPGWLAMDDAYVTATSASLGSSCKSGPTWADSPFDGQDNLPLNCATWQEAYAFCIWDGAFLPTETELEYAAAGGSRQLEYPWGTAAPGTGNQYAIYGDYYPGSPTGSVKYVAPVGTAILGVGVWGQLDLEGELYELALDAYSSGYADPCTDCVFPASTALTSRVARGGLFNGNAASLVTPKSRTSITPTRRSVSGFRCARTP